MNFIVVSMTMAADSVVVVPFVSENAATNAGADHADLDGGSGNLITHIYMNSEDEELF